jgi:TRAP-type C4-dicarboxylate transport system substrate-binding protein
VRALLSALVLMLCLKSGLALGQSATPEALQRWNQLSEAEKQKLRAAQQELARLSEPERQRLLQHYEQFRKLPPAEQQAMRERYRAFQQLPEKDRETIRHSFERYAAKGSEERQHLREVLAHLDKLTPAEKADFVTKLERWRSLSPEQRERVRERVRERRLERLRANHAHGR